MCFAVLLPTLPRVRYVDTAPSNLEGTEESITLKAPRPVLLLMPHTHTHTHTHTPLHRSRLARGSVETTLWGKV